jgi:hypothetical protein
MSENDSEATTSEEAPSKVLVYVGPSLDNDQVLERIPDAIIRPPIRQSDLISDLLEYEPSHILIIDGEFSQNLSVWQKEIVYGLQLPGVKAIYGAASMGALRAADLADFGMIGCGAIFGWYDEGVITDESEVSLLYYRRPDGSYISTTIPLVNIRARLLTGIEEGALTLEQAEKVFAYARSIPWTERTHQALSRLGPTWVDWLLAHDQKKADALELLCTFSSLRPRASFTAPQIEDLSHCFKAQFERDRLVEIKGTRVALQYIDQFITLHDIDYSQKLWDANNRAAALLLCDMYRVTLSQKEFDVEWSRFCARHNLATVEIHTQWLKENNINLREFCRLMLENGRLRKLHRAIRVRSMHRRNTQRLLDYLRTADAYSYWAMEAAEFEKKITQSGQLETLTIDLSISPHRLMLEHLEKSGQSIDGDLETYANESGFNSLAELSVALERDKLGGTSDA